MCLWQSLGERISAATGTRFTVENKIPVSGGCINQSYCISDARQTFFLKYHPGEQGEMFAAEAQGLQALSEAQALRIPQPLVWDKHFLVMEYIALDGRAQPARLGERLARQHRVLSTQHGWHRDNTIGSTPQINQQTADWISFWREHRLGFQLTLAANTGGGSRLRDKGERVLQALPVFFSNYTPQASLLHGDLWGGNIGADHQGNPVIFDPAVYYGDRETDLAMTELFGGPGEAFYSAYTNAWPLDPGYGVRKHLYNLYHILNHYNLFGGAYAAQAERLCDALLSEAG